MAKNVDFFRPLFVAFFDGGLGRFLLRGFFRIHTFGHDAYSTQRGCEIRYTPIPAGTLFYNPQLLHRQSDS